MQHMLKNIWHYYSVFLDSYQSISKTISSPVGWSSNPLTFPLLIVVSQAPHRVMPSQLKCVVSRNEGVTDALQLCSLVGALVLCKVREDGGAWGGGLCKCEQNEDPGHGQELFLSEWPRSHTPKRKRRRSLCALQSSAKDKSQIKP